MKKVKCKKCDCEIYTEYSPIESLNIRDKKSKKYFSELNDKPSETCNTGIYLTCDNRHTEKYYCKIKKVSL